jgi:hypothetical protein
MSTQATHEDANLILRLYELRREPKLREARDWFGLNFSPSSFEEWQKQAPPGSKENTYARMVGGYWEMACSLVTAGTINQELFFQSNGEMLFVWERVRNLVPEMRTMMKNPQIYHNLETVANQYINYLNKQSPEFYPAFQAMVKGVRTAGGGR